MTTKFMTCDLCTEATECVALACANGRYVCRRCSEATEFQWQLHDHREEDERANALAAANGFLLGGREPGKPSVSVMLMGSLAGGEPTWQVQAVPPPPPPGTRPEAMPVSEDAKSFETQAEALRYGREFLDDLRAGRP